MTTPTLKEQKRAQNLAQSRKMGGQVHHPGGKQVTYKPNAQSRQLDEKARDLRGQGRTKRTEAKQNKQTAKKARDATRLSKMKKDEARKNLVSEKRWEEAQKEREKEMQEKGQTLEEWQKAKEDLAKTEDKKSEQAKTEAGNLSRQAASHSRQAERAERTTAPGRQAAYKGAPAPPTATSSAAIAATGSMPSNLIQQQALARENRLKIIQQQTAQAQLNQARWALMQQDEESQTAQLAEQKAIAEQKKSSQQQEDQLARAWWLIQMLETVLQWFGILLGAIPFFNSLQTTLRGINTKFKGVGKSIPYMDKLAPGYAPGRRQEDILVVLGAIATVVVAIPILFFAGLIFAVAGYVMMNPVEAVTVMPALIIELVQTIGS